MRRIDRQILRAGLSSLAVILALIPLVGPTLASLATLGFALGQLFAAWNSEFRTGHQADLMALAHQKGASSLSPETKRFVADIRTAILDPDTLNAYNPEHDASLKSLGAACLGLLCLFLAVGPGGLLAALFLLLVAEIRRPKIQAGIRLAWRTPS